MEVNSESWTKFDTQNIETKSKNFELIEVWARLIDERLKMYILVRKYENNNYIIKTYESKKDINLIKTFKKMILNGFRNVSLNIKSGTISYSETHNDTIKVEKLETLSKFNDRDVAKQKLMDVLN